MNRLEHLPKTANYDRVSLPYYTATQRRWFFFRAQPPGPPRTKRGARIGRRILLGLTLAGLVFWGISR